MNFIENSHFMYHLEWLLQSTKTWISYIVIHRRSSPMRFPDDQGLSPIVYDIWKPHYRQPPEIIPNHRESQTCGSRRTIEWRTIDCKICYWWSGFLSRWERNCSARTKWIMLSNLRVQESNEGNINNTHIMETSTRVNKSWLAISLHAPKMASQRNALHM